MQGNMFAIGLLAVAILVFVVIVNILDNRGLNRIKSKKVGDGQHGTARWASPSEISRTFSFLPFEPQAWREGKNLPTISIDPSVEPLSAT